MSTREAAVQAMTEWFHRHYKNPSEILPTESGGEGFQYIYGGPFEARDVLEQKFGDPGTYSDEDIEAAAVAIEADGVVDWSPAPPFDGAVASLNETATRMFDSLSDKEKALIQKRFSKKEGE